MKTPLLLVLAAASAARPLLAQTGAEEQRALETRLKSPDDKEKVNALFDAARKVGTAEALALIPPFFTYANAYVSDRAIAALSETSNAPAFEALVKKLFTDTNPKVRRAAVEALTRTRLGTSSELALGLLADADPECKLLTLQLLAAKPVKGAPAPLVKAAQPAERDVKVRATALLALAACDASAAGPLLTAALKEKEPTVRVGALLAAETAGRDAVATAVPALADPDRRVRHAAITWLARARPAAAVPPLLDRLAVESGRLQDAAERALRSITLRDFGSDVKAWRSWWESAAKDFTPPPLDKSKPVPVEASHGETRVDLPRYLDVVVRSDRVAFLVDVSGSMRELYAPLGGTVAEGSKRTRLEVVADALHDVIAKLPKETHATVILFNSEPIRYRDTSKSKGGTAIEPSVKTAADVKKFVLAIGASKATNISDALELVIDDPEVDTVYLLTDGAPSAGKRNLGSRIVDWARRTTALSRVEVHTIAFGAKDRDADFLRKLAEATGGTFALR